MRQIRSIVQITNTPYYSNANSPFKLKDIVVVVKLTSIEQEENEFLYRLSAKVHLMNQDDHHEWELCFGSELRLATEEEVIAYKLLGPTDLP